MYIYSCVVRRRQRETVTLPGLDLACTHVYIFMCSREEKERNSYEITSKPSCRMNKSRHTSTRISNHPITVSTDNTTTPKSTKRNGHSCRYTFTLDRFFELECVLRDTEQLTFRIWWIWRWVLCKRNTVIREAAVRRLDAKVYRANRRNQQGRKTSFQRILTPVQRFTRDVNECEALGRQILC